MYRPQEGLPVLSRHSYGIWLPVRETAEQKANRIIAQERTRLGGPPRNRELRQGLALDLDNARPT